MYGWCPWGVPEVPSGIVGTSYTKSNLGSTENPNFEKNGRFSLYACGNGVNLPHEAKHAFGDQMGPNMQRAMLLGSPPHQGLKNCGLCQKNIFYLSTFFGLQGCFPRFSRCWRYFVAGVLFDGSGRTRKAQCSVGSL